jgi:hypothetical protein
MTVIDAITAYVVANVILALLPFALLTLIFLAVWTYAVIDDLRQKFANKETHDD